MELNVSNPYSLGKVRACVCVCAISLVMGVSDGSQRRGRCNESEREHFCAE